MQKKDILKALDFLKKGLSSDDTSQSAIIHLEGKVESLAWKTSKKATPLLPQTFPLPAEVLRAEGSFALFSDGASRGNPGPGAWGAVGQNCSGDILFESSSVDTMTTNNKMELGGAIAALEWMVEHQNEVDLVLGQHHVFLYSDSKYVVDGTNSWMPGWKRRGWKKADKKAPENLDLWQQMDRVASEFSHLKLLWVKGHNGHPQNEHCDFLANKALDDTGF